MTVKIWARRILLGFVLVTVGFALGRQTAPRAEPAAAAAGPGDHLVVYAAHMTFRCAECTQIESYTRDLLTTEFADALANGRIRIVIVDYLKDPDFAARYDISSSTLVLARIQDGRETHAARLDQVWTHVRDQAAFTDYVRRAIQDELSALDGEI